ncbi:zinc finger protein 280D isoform X1 [Patella vulgata]|uniref:zinc finger protein 280D isoform X1 n=1 Tax=Patella vulgata TaxID=6465 RepID=UPI00217F9975|nr:zinc finger protein 280D isoform X1 [Patella vulgata]
MPKSTRRASMQAMYTMNKHTFSSDVRLLMECTEEDLLPCQKDNYKNALDEFNRVSKYIENVKSGKVQIQSLPSTSLTSTTDQQVNDPDIIVIGESPPQQKTVNQRVAQRQAVSNSPVANLTIPPLPVSAIPQQVYKFVNGQQSNVVKVGNQIFIRPMMTVAPQPNAPMVNVTQSQIQAASNLIPMTMFDKRAELESQRRLGLSKKEVDSSGNWVPLDEFYYGKKEGDPTYIEEKGEYRFKCWFCSKMLYNNVKTMMHMQGHIDSEKQQNLDLSDLTQCKHCYKQFDTPFEMQTHIEKVHLNNSNVLMCRICEKDHESRVGLTSHMRQNHNACEMPYICQLCEFRSSMYSDVVDHFKKKHDSSENMLCLYCLKAFHVKFVSTGWGQTQNYYHHLLKHQSKNKIRKCQVCKLTFFNPQDLKAHRRKDHQANIKGVIGMNSKYTTPDQVMIKVPEQGLQPKQIKSLNAPAVSKVRDNHLVLPGAVNQIHCMECKMLMGTQDHYKKYIQCSMCRFATSCSFAYANHMMGFHSGQMTALSLNVPKERPMEHVMYCMCGYASIYGNNIANHMVYCTKRTCYKDKPDVPINDYENKEIQDPRNKPGASLLDVLGLVKRPTPSQREDVDLEDDYEAAGSSSDQTGQRKKSGWFRIRLQDKPKKTSDDEREDEEEMDQSENASTTDDVHNTDNNSANKTSDNIDNTDDNSETTASVNTTDGSKLQDQLCETIEDTGNTSSPSDSKKRSTQDTESIENRVETNKNKDIIKVQATTSDTAASEFADGVKSTIQDGKTIITSKTCTEMETDVPLLPNSSAADTVSPLSEKGDNSFDNTGSADANKLGKESELHSKAADIEKIESSSPTEDSTTETLVALDDKKNSNSAREEDMSRHRDSGLREKYSNDSKEVHVDKEKIERSRPTEDSTKETSVKLDVNKTNNSKGEKEISRQKDSGSMEKHSNDSQESSEESKHAKYSESSSIEETHNPEENSDKHVLEEESGTSGSKTAPEESVEKIQSDTKETEKIGDKTVEDNILNKTDSKTNIINTDDNKTKDGASSSGEMSTPQGSTQPEEPTLNQSYITGSSSLDKNCDHSDGGHNRRHSSSAEQSSDRSHDYKDKDRSYKRRSDDYNRDRDRDRSRDYHRDDRDRKYDRDYDRHGRDRSREYGYHGGQSNRGYRRDGHRDRDRNRDRDRDYYDNRNYGRQGKGQGHHGGYRDRNSYY